MIRQTLFKIIILVKGTTAMDFTVREMGSTQNSQGGEVGWKIIEETSRVRMTLAEPI